MEKPRLGISACLLGQLVRYDGQHKLDRFLTDTLGKFVEYVPVCPEVECGLPVPREAMRLVGNPSSPSLVTQRTGRDLTEQMLSWADCRVRDLEKERLCGYIFKSRSPSSGMQQVKVYSAKGAVIGRASGLFAKAFMQHFPLLPAEDEGRLHDPDIRENFMERIFALNRYREALKPRPALRRLTEFHASHKLLIMSHNQETVRKMGRLLAGASRTTLAEVGREYERLLLAALTRHATVAKHCNVLHHMLGYFKKDISGAEKEEMLDVIDRYRNELVPLIVPVTLLSHYARKYGVTYLQEQVYLNPHPFELKLRNHA